MLTYNFEFLTNNENLHVSNKINKLEKIKERGLLTNKELQYSFLQFLNKHYKKHTFEIYTNSRTNFN